MRKDGSRTEMRRRWTWAVAVLFVVHAAATTPSGVMSRKRGPADGAGETTTTMAMTPHDNFSSGGVDGQERRRLSTGFWRAAKEIQTIVAFDGAVGDRFGESLAVDGQILAVGAPLDYDAGVQSGSVFVFTQTDQRSWELSQKLIPSDRVAAGRFGALLAISTTTLVVTSIDSVYIYRNDGGTTSWIFVQKLDTTSISDGAPTSAPTTSTGPSAPTVVQVDDRVCFQDGCDISSSFSLDGCDQLVAASLLVEVKGDLSDTGEYAELFINGDYITRCSSSVDCPADFETCGAVDSLLPLLQSDGTLELELDSSSAVNAFCEDTDFTDYTLRSRFTYAFSCAIVTRPTGCYRGEFARSLSIDGANLVVGTYWGDAYVFTSTDGSAWNLVQRLSASDGVASDHFGSAVAISGDFIVVGAEFDDDLGTKSGSAYVFRTADQGESWQQIKKLVATDGAAGAVFGHSVGISGNNLVVGAPGASAAYCFRLVAGRWTQTDILVASDARVQFGRAVFVSGTNIVVGSTGEADIFSLADDSASWTFVQKLGSSDGGSSVEFVGIRLALSGTTIVGGVPSIDAGRVYAYTLETCAAIAMADSNGDGWNGGSYTFTSTTTGSVVDGTLELGGSGSDDLCLADGCYTLEVGGGDFDSEISWSFVTLAGGAPYGPTHLVVDDGDIVETSTCATLPTPYAPTRGGGTSKKSSKGGSSMYEIVGGVVVGFLSLVALAYAAYEAYWTQREGPEGEPGFSCRIWCRNMFTCNHIEICNVSSGNVYCFVCCNRPKDDEEMKADEKEAEMTEAADPIPEAHVVKVRLAPCFGRRCHLT